MLKHRGKVEPVPDGMRQVGPIVNVVIGPITLAGEGQPVSSIPGSQVLVPLMVDTGAQITCIEDSVLSGALGLVPIRYMPVSGVDATPQHRPVYRVSVLVAMEDRASGKRSSAIFSTDAVGVPSPHQPQQHKGLLGRDFLQYVKFIYDGPSGSFEIIDESHSPAVIQRAKPERNKALEKTKKDARRKNRR